MSSVCPQDGDVEGGTSAEDLKDELLGSGDVVLVEAEVRDMLNMFGLPSGYVKKRAIENDHV